MYIKENPHHIKYIEGYGDDTFKPNQTVTRGEVLTMFSRLTDVDEDKTHEDVYMSLGIIRNDNSKELTRYEFADKLISLVDIDEEIEIVESQYTDINVNNIAYRNLLIATELGFIN